MNIVIVQTCVPDYRVPFFSEMARRFPGLRVFSGDTFFAEDVKTGARGQAWDQRVENRFFVRRGLCWQIGLWKAAMQADVLVAELNVRVASTMLILLLRRLLGRRTVLWGHVWGRHSFSKRFTWPRIFAARLADAVIAYTVTDATTMATWLIPFRVHAATNSSVLRSDCLPAIKPDKAPHSIICVGRLNASKKPLLLVDAFALALPSLPPDAHLMLVGEGDERNVLTKRIAELELADRVTLTGHVSSVDQLRSYYADAVVAVSPGYVGLSAIQCMAFGVPMAISRDEPHAPEIEACIEGVNCRFFETDNPAALAETLIEFFRNRSEWLNRRESISNQIAGNYTIEAMADGYERAIRFAAPARFQPERTAIIWEQYGPYHLARLHAAEAALGPDRVIGIEMSREIESYAWKRNEIEAAKLRSLTAGRAAENVPARLIYARASRLFRLQNVRTVFVPSYWPKNSLALLLATKDVGARAIMMNESHAGTARARGILAVIKKRMVGWFDGALLGGTPQVEYFASMGIPRERIFTGYDAVDNGFFGREADRVRSDADLIRRQLGLPDRFFLNIGRMEEKKDLATLVRAFAKYRTSHPEGPRLVLVGSGSEKSNLLRLCLELGMTICQNDRGAQDVSADVFFYGFRQIAELPAFYALCEAFILPSTLEEWGLVVNEALASGAACIVSRNVGSSTDLILNNSTGLLFDAGDSDALAGCLDRIGSDPALAEKLGRNGRNHVQSWGLDQFGNGVINASRVSLRARNHLP